MRKVAAILAATLWCGCQPHKNPSIHLLIAHQGVSTDGRCYPATATDADTAIASTQATRVRISIRLHEAGDPNGSFLCDRILSVPADQPTFKLPISGAATVDVIAEAFAPAPDGTPASAGPYLRVATGGLYGESLTTSALPPLRLYPAQSFACVDSRLTVGRAFHSATLLPNGQVLVAGGLVASPSDPTVENLDAGRLYATGSVEIYDPSDGSFQTVSDSGTAVPRAFHQAVLLSSQAPYQVLLVGGVTTPMAGMPVLAVAGDKDGMRLVARDPMSGAALPTTAAPAEILTYDPTARTLTRSLLAGFAPAAFQGGAALGNGLAVAGGVAFQATSGQLAAVDQVGVIRKAGDTPRTGATQAGRAGSTLTAISDDEALLWGGDLAADDPIAELVHGLSAGGKVTSAPVAPLAGVTPTQFHSATRVDQDPTLLPANILITGGFAVTSAGALEPPLAAQAVRLVKVDAQGNVSLGAVPFDGGYVSDPACANPARYRPAGWQSAVALPRGRVLITGGAPTYVAGGCNDCESGTQAGRLCALRQASIFVPTTLSPADVNRGSPGLRVARLGHSSTLLADGTVLIVGGITSPPDGGAQRVAAGAEIYNPRTVVPPYDMTAAMPVDADDPLAGDLQSVLLARAPGYPAYVQGGTFTTAARSCGSL